MAERWQQWMPFHIDKFRGSPEVQAMHPAARCGYIYLLASAWQSADCSLSADAVDLATESGLGDELWSVHGPRILRKFRLREDGRLTNDVLLKEWTEALKVYEKRKSGAVRTNSERSATAERAQSSRNTDTQTETLTSTDTVKPLSKPTVSHPGKPGNADPVEEIYKAYPRKEAPRNGKKAIANAHKRLVKGESPHSPMEPRAAFEFMYRATKDYAHSPRGSDPDKTHIPHPATWFNESRYLDDRSLWQTRNGNFGQTAPPPARIYAEPENDYHA